MIEPLRILSLGAGVQSTTLALMAARGEIEMPNCAIFADTGDEPSAVYRHLDWLESELPFPVHRVTAGHLGADLLAGREDARIPAFIGADGGMKQRQCTRNYKIRPIRRKVRQLLGDVALVPGLVEQWIGISVDEAIRMKPSDVTFVTHRWPLIEKRLSRRDCLRWLADRQYATPPKSSCTFCPYRSDQLHRELRDGAPDDWARAVAFDEELRSPANVKRFHGEMYVHRSRQPLSEVPLTALERGQPDFFLNDCEGMCGV